MHAVKYQCKHMVLFCMFANEIPSIYLNIMLF